MSSNCELSKPENSSSESWDPLRMITLFRGGEAADSGETIEGADESVDDCDPAGPALFIEVRCALFVLLVAIDVLWGWLPLTKCSGIFGLGGKSYKADEIDPRTRWGAALSDAPGRRFFNEP